MIAFEVDNLIFWQKPTAWDNLYGFQINIVLKKKHNYSLGKKVLTSDLVSFFKYKDESIIRHYPKNY